MSPAGPLVVARASEAGLEPTQSFKPNGPAIRVLWRHLTASATRVKRGWVRTVAEDVASLFVTGTMIVRWLPVLVSIRIRIIAPSLSGVGAVVIGRELQLCDDCHLADLAWEHPAR